MMLLKLWFIYSAVMTVRGWPEICKPCDEMNLLGKKMLSCDEINGKLDQFLVKDEEHGIQIKESYLQIEKKMSDLIRDQKILSKDFQQGINDVKFQLFNNLDVQHPNLKNWIQISQTHEFCPTGWVKSPFSDECFYFESRGVNFTDAVNFCQDIGGSLVSVHSKEENDFIIRDLTKNSWLGLNDLENEGTFLWMDGTGITFKDFAPNNPSNSGGLEDCMEYVFIPDEDGFKWNDIDCSKTRPPICERKSETLPRKKCPEGWTQHGKNCFILRNHENTYANALSDCQLLAAASTIAAPENEEENKFLFTFLNRHKTQGFWIGITDKGRNGIFTKSDLTLPHYSPWGRGEPHNPHSIAWEYCILLEQIDGLWHDIPCDRLQKYVCQTASRLGVYNN